jgi:hypothetical protein
VIRRIGLKPVWANRKIALETLSQKHPSHKRAGGVAQGGPQVQNPVPQKKKKNPNTRRLRHKDYEFKTSVGYIGRPHQEKQTKIIHL